MKKICILIISNLIISCGVGPKPNPDKHDKIYEFLEKMVIDCVEGGGVADIGFATSRQRDIALNEAKREARTQLAQIYETSVQSLGKKFSEEVGSGFESEINEMFSEVSKQLTKTTLKLSRPLKTKSVLDKFAEGTMYNYYVVMGIEPNKLNEQLFTGLEKKNKKMYERFRASKAYEELDKEMEEYENNKEKYEEF